MFQCRPPKHFELALLENTIKKIGGLLRVGFGEAGAEIITANMNTNGELDPCQWCVFSCGIVLFQIHSIACFILHITTNTHSLQYQWFIFQCTIL